MYNKNTPLQIIGIVIGNGHSKSQYYCQPDGDVKTDILIGNNGATNQFGGKCDGQPHENKTNVIHIFKHVGIHKCIQTDNDADACKHQCNDIHGKFGVFFDFIRVVIRDDGTGHTNRLDRTQN